MFPYRICFASALFYLFTFSAHTQTRADFENIVLPGSGFLNNGGSAGGFSSGYAFLRTRFDPAFQTWDGWAVSRITDNITPGFNNQYSAIPGSGAEGSAQYVVAYAYSEAVIRLTKDAAGGIVNGLYVTNGTYPYRSMKDGDQFAKKFGGETGNDPDFFKLIVKKWYQGTLHPDTVTFFLADYRFSDNARDYIVKDWHYLDTRRLGNADSLQCTLLSSDTGQFGMNTPAYFCADNIITADKKVNTDPSPHLSPVRIAPNPARTHFMATWETEAPAAVSVVNTLGQPLIHIPHCLAPCRIEVNGWEPAWYVVRVATESGISVQKMCVE